MARTLDCRVEAKANHRQLAAPAVSTRKPSHGGSKQNHKPKNAAPTASEAIVVAHPSHARPPERFQTVDVS
jgi:hypothetical protein